MSHRGCDVSAEFPELFPEGYVPGGMQRRLEEEDDSSDDEQAIIVLDALTDRSTALPDSERTRVSFSPDTILHSYRSGGDHEVASSPLYYIDEDQGFVDGDDTPTSSKGSIMTQARGKPRKDHKEKLEKVSDRRQRFHRGFNYIRGRYPSQMHGADKGTPRGKNPTFRPPASFCPPSRYAREARVQSAKDREGKAKKWREPPVYPPRQKVKDVGVDCEILRLVETLDIGSQAVAATADVACQRPLPMVDAAVQYPRTRRRDCGTQASQPKTQSTAVQHAAQTRNVMVETCQRLIYHPNNFVVTDEKQTQTSAEYVQQDFPNMYQYQQPIEYTLDSKSEYRSVVSVTPDSPLPMRSPEPPFYHPMYENQLRLVLPSDSRSVSMTSQRQDSLDYSSDWDDSDNEDTNTETGSVSVAVRDDAHDEWHFADVIFKSIFLNKNSCNFIQISPTFVTKLGSN